MSRHPVPPGNKGKSLKPPVQKKEKNNTGLPDNLKSGVENLSGISMDDVKVHYNSSQPAQLNAHAYAQGNQIHIASGQEKHLPHEAWHVVQQKQGRVKPTMQMKGKVNINDDKGLEKEADVMGGKAQAEMPGLKDSERFHNSTYGKPPAVVQRVVLPGLYDGFGEEVDTQYMLIVHNYIVHALLKNNEEAIETLLEQARILDPGKVEEIENDISAQRIIIASRSKRLESVDHHEIGKSVHEEGMHEYEKEPLTEEDENRWAELALYIQLTLAAPEKAPVTKLEGFNASDLKTLNGEALTEESRKAAQGYIDQFRIVSKEEFDGKLEKIALALTTLGKYSCIVSEVGKSNFWITGKVLDKVKKMGGKPPARVISVPVQEKGMADKGEMGVLAKELEDAGHIVFLDDGTYSGSQLVRLVNRVIGKAQLAHSIGLVAMSNAAQAKIHLRDQANLPGLLGAPIDIPIYHEGNLDKVHRELGIPVHQEIPDKEMEPPDGNALLGLYYKLPDYASVRHKLLAGDKARPGPIKGYEAGSGLPVRVHNTMKIGRKGASEPYKDTDFLKTIASTDSLSELGIVDHSGDPPKAMGGMMMRKYK